MEDLESMKKAIATVCINEPHIRLGYIFGSYVWSNPDLESDVDIAILLDSKLSKKERWKFRVDAISRFATSLSVPMEKIDLIVLQDVPVLLRYNAVVHAGMRVFERDTSERIAFELRVEQEWDDEYYYLKRENDYILKNMLSSPAL